LFFFIYFFGGVYRCPHHSHILGCNSDRRESRTHARTHGRATRKESRAGIRNSRSSQAVVDLAESPS
jgi:hypothetical protein